MLHRDEEPTAVPKQPPRKIGPYKILGELGRGGMGVVYLAKEEDLGREVALKVLNLQGMNIIDGADRFLREAQAVAQLSHENIVQVYASGRTDEVLYLAMEYVKGEPLGRRIGENGPKQEEIARIGARVAWALQHAHEKEVIHRDIKPDNILLDEQGEPRVVDFGLARKPDNLSLTMTGDILGTPMYMSPEQAQGRRDLDHRADVYSLGMTLYALAAGKPPFDTERPVLDLLKRLETEDPPALPDKVHRDLATIIFKAVHKIPARRYASARELAEDLERFIRREPIQARPPNVREKVSRFIRRHHVAAKFTSLPVLFVLTVVVYFLLRPGFLTIEVQPENARVFLDGKIVEKRNRIRLPAGAYSIRVECDGHVPAEAVATVRRGWESRIPVRLERARGWLTVQTMPFELSAEVWQDRKLVLRTATPLLRRPLPVGDYDVRVEEPGMFTEWKRVRIGLNEETSVLLRSSPNQMHAFFPPKGGRLVGVPSHQSQAGILGLITEEGVVAPIRGSVLRRDAIFQKPELDWMKFSQERWDAGAPIHSAIPVPFGEYWLVWLVREDGGSVLFDTQKGKKRWETPAVGLVRHVLAWKEEYWILTEENWVRINPNKGRLIGTWNVPTAERLLALGAYDSKKRRCLTVQGRTLSLWEDGKEVKVDVDGTTRRLAVADIDGDGSREVVRLDENRRLVAHSGSDLKELWRSELEDPVSLCASTGLVVVQSGNRGFHIFDAGGKEVGRWEVGEDVTHPSILADMDADGELELVLFQYKRVETRDPRSGWLETASLIGPKFPTHQALVHDFNGDGFLDITMMLKGNSGQLVVSFIGRRVLWDSGTGTKSKSPVTLAKQDGRAPRIGGCDWSSFELLDARWDKRLWARPGSFSPLIPPLYVPSTDAWCLRLVSEGLICYSDDNGDELWRVGEYDGRVFVPPLLMNLVGDAEDEILLVMSRKNPDDTHTTLILAHDAKTGRVVWSHDIEGIVDASPAIRDGVLFVGTRSGRVLAIDVKEKKEKWSLEFGGSIVHALSFTPDQGLLLAVNVGGPKQGRYIMIHPGTGKVDRRFGLNGPPSVPIWEKIKGAWHLIFGTVDGYLVCHRWPDGERIWYVRLKGRVRYPAVPFSEDRLAVICDEGMLAVVHRREGTVQWRLRLEGAPGGAVKFADLNRDGRPELIFTLFTAPESGVRYAVGTGGRPWTNAWAGRSGNRFANNCVER